VLLPESLLAMVSVPEPKVTLPPVLPPPASDAMLLLKLLRLSMAPATLAMLTALLAEKASAAPACKVPALTLVAPV